MNFKKINLFYFGVPLISLAMLLAWFVSVNDISNIVIIRFIIVFAVVGCFCLLDLKRILFSLVILIFTMVMMVWVSYLYLGAEVFYNKGTLLIWEPFIVISSFCLSFIIIRFLLFKQIISFGNYLWGVIGSKDVVKAIVAFVIVYACLILLFSMIYATIYKMDGPETFKIGFTKVNFSHFLYYSVVTSTTLGYGDITPISPMAITFSIIEVIVSVIFVGLYLGSVISILSSQRGAKDEST